MKNISIYFPSLDEKYLSHDMYKLTRSDFGVYSYFKAEYSRALPFDPEKDMMDCEVKTKKNVLLEKIKDKLVREKKSVTDKAVAISPNSSSYLFFKSEFKGNPFLQDIDNNILIPYESYKKIKTRK